MCVGVGSGGRFRKVPECAGGSGGFRCRFRKQVPEGSGEFRGVAGVGSGRFRKVLESSGVCWCRFGK